MPRIQLALSAVGRIGRRGVSTANACRYQRVAPAGVVRCTDDCCHRGRTFGRRHRSGRKHDLAATACVHRRGKGPRGSRSEHEVLCAAC